MRIPGRRFARAVLGTIIAASGTVAAVLAQEPPAFRSGVDLIRVDAQVVDNNGSPVTGLTPNQFEVSIDGKRRKVVSADFLRFATTTKPGSSAPSVAAARDAAREFIGRVQPNDLVGLISFPDGPLVDVTTDRERVLRELERLTGQKAPAGMNQYGLTPSEIVDISKAPPCIVPSSETRDSCLEALKEIDLVLAGRLASVCASTLQRSNCTRTLLADGMMMARIEEAEVARRLGAFQSVLKSLAVNSRRKVVMLISAGVMLSDQVGGQPNLGDVGRLIGQSAAEGNSVVYSLFFDRAFLDMTGASSRGSGRVSQLRDTTIVSNSLHQIAGTSGGLFFNSRWSAISRTSFATTERLTHRGHRRRSARVPSSSSLR